MTIMEDLETKFNDICEYYYEFPQFEETEDYRAKIKKFNEELNNNKLFRLLVWVFVDYTECPISSDRDAVAFVEAVDGVIKEVEYF